MMPSGLRISWAMLAVMIAGVHDGLPEGRFVSDQLELLLVFCLFYTPDAADGNGRGVYGGVWSG